MHERRIAQIEQKHARLCTPCRHSAELLAEVRSLRDGIVRHRDALRNRGVDGRGTPAQAPNERLWALVDQQEDADG